MKRGLKPARSEAELCSRAVIDTSSLVSYVLARGDLMRRVVAHWRANGFVVLSSPATPAELAAVLSRPQIQRLAVAPLDPLIQGLERYTWHVPGALDLTGACRDPKDDKFLACAVEGRPIIWSAATKISWT